MIDSLKNPKNLFLRWKQFQWKKWIGWTMSWENSFAKCGLCRLARRNCSISWSHQTVVCIRDILWNCSWIFKEFCSFLCWKYLIRMCYQLCTCYFLLQFTELNDNHISVGKIYVGLIIAENWRAYKSSQSKMNNLKMVCASFYQNMCGILMWIR